MAERPFMQLYVSDFLGDTLHLSAEQVGVYALILAAIWNADGNFPDDERKRARIARVSVKRWRKIWPTLEPLFVRDREKLSSPYIRKVFSKASVFGRQPLAPAVRQAIYDRDGYVCHYCGDTEGPFHVDHVHAFSRGGSDDLSNLVVACARCNLSKGAKRNWEWVG